MRSKRLWALVLGALALFLLVGVSPVPAADEAAAKLGQPLVTVSFAGYDKLIQDVNTVAKLGGNADAVKPVEAQIQEALGKEAFDALDKTKPWGAVLTTDAQGTNFNVVGFLPIKDVKPVLEALKQKGIQSKEADGVFEVKIPQGSAFVKQAGDWALVSYRREALAAIPADPTKLLGGLNEKYTLAVSAAIKNLPQALRDQGIGFLTMMAQLGMMQQPGETEEAAAVRRKMMEQTIEQLKKALNDLDTLVIGLNVDQKATLAYLDFSVTAKPGTEMAKQAEAAKDAKSDFAGMLAADAAVTLSMVGKLDQQQIAQTKTQLEVFRTNALGELDKQGLSEEQMKMAKQVVGDLFDVATKTIEGGKVDAAGMLKLDPKAASLVVGMLVADGAKLEGVVKQLVEQVGKDDPEAAKKIKLNAEQHKGVSFHVLSVPVDQIPGAPQEELTRVFGKTVDLIVGTSDKAVYLAAGRDASKELKQAIDQAQAGAGKAVPPMQFVVAATPIAQFAASLVQGREKAQVEKVAKLLAAEAGKDHVRVTQTIIPNGAQTRLELEQGILKLLGSIPQLVQGGE